jgi:hypothetical protein
VTRTKAAAQAETELLQPNTKTTSLTAGHQQLPAAHQLLHDGGHNQLHEGHKIQTMSNGLSRDAAKPALTPELPELEEISQVAADSTFIAKLSFRCEIVTFLSKTNSRKI